MANLERTTRTSIEGGGFNMTEEGLQIIEDYLSLVKAHLPADIAEEVIEELRSYIREAASDNEEGMITNISAKRTVARFGAPSEVAEEYRFSMDAERITEETHQTPITSESEFTQEEILIIDETRETTPHDTGHVSEDESRKSDYFETLIQTLFLIVCWSLIIGISGLPFTLLMTAGQIAAACVIFPLYFLYRKGTGVVLRDRTFEEWPWHLKVTTLPAGTFEPARQPFITMEIIFLFAGLIGFIATLFVSPLALLAIPFILFRFRFLREYANESFTPEDVKGEYALNISFALVLNFIMGISIWFPSSWPLIFIIPFCSLYGFYLVVILATTMAELWTETISISEIQETPIQQTPASADEIREYESSEEVTQAQDAMLVVIPEKEIEADRFKGLPVSYKRIVLKIMAISVLWLTITGFFAFILFPTSLYPPGVILLLGMFQLPPILFVSIIKVLRMKKRKLLPWPSEDSNWSRLRKSLTFPDHVFDKQNTIALRLDLFVTFCVGAYFLFINLINVFPNAIVFFSMLFAGATMLRFAFLNHRWSNPESEKYNKREFASTFLLLLLGNILLVISTTSNSMWYFFGFSQHYDYIVFQASIPILFLPYGWYLLYSLVSRGKMLWKKIQTQRRLQQTV